MDTITHALAGALIGTAVKERTGRTGMACALAVSLVPDADMLLRLFGPVVYLQYHRVVLNSLLVAPLVALAVALAAWFAGGYRKFFPLLLISLAAVGMHVFMDFTNSYGFVPFWPLKDGWHALDMVFIIDPWVTGALLLGLLAARMPSRKIIALAACAVFLVGYWGARAYLHSWAERSFRIQYPEASKLGAFPAPVNPFKWRMVAETNTAYWAGWYNVLDGEWEGLQMYPRMPMDKALRLAKDDEVAQKFLKFARFPWVSYEAKDGAWLVKIQDLRFSFSDRRGGFVTTVKVLPDGTTDNGEFSFR